jgi:hypothetical protein
MLAREQEKFSPPLALVLGTANPGRIEMFAFSSDRHPDTRRDLVVSALRGGNSFRTVWRLFPDLGVPVGQPAGALYCHIVRPWPPPLPNLTLIYLWGVLSLITMASCHNQVALLWLILPHRKTPRPTILLLFRVYCLPW